MPPLAQKLRAHLKTTLRPLVERVLLGRAATLGASASRLSALEAGLVGVETRLVHLERARHSLVFTAHTTVEQALAMHPDVARLLAERGLTGCSSCPVRAEETLEEIAQVRGFSLAEWLEALNRLLASSGA